MFHILIVLVFGLLVGEQLLICTAFQASQQCLSDIFRMCVAAFFASLVLTDYFCPFLIIFIYDLPAGMCMLFNTAC